MARTIYVDPDATDDGLVITVTDADDEPEAFVSLTEDEAWQLLDVVGRYLAENPAEEHNLWNPVI